MSKYEMQDIQYLLLMYREYIEDTTTYDSAWEDKEFARLCKKYGFTKENINYGFEFLFS